MSAWVVAPDREMSAASHSLTLHKPLRVKEIAHQRYTVNGTPTDCVNLGVNSVLKMKPDLIVSGINKGGNLAGDIVYSGTVAAAREGTMLGIPSFAISLVAEKDFEFRNAADFALKVAVYVLEKGLPAGTFLNVNVPDEDIVREPHYKITRQGRRIHGGSIVEKVDPRGEKYYWFGNNNLGFEEIEGSDSHAVSQGYISITPLCLDLTDYSFMEEMSACFSV
ncbi:MAG: 5'/3'-nucleotidase SurE [Thermodesulfobacteriota bacterium]|nr:5'/3'-nucleotidase SurE [Thermodesulfobacteriota bacterium]